MFLLCAHARPSRLAQHASCGRARLMMSFTSGTLVYWNAHSGFGEIDLDSGYDRVGIYRADLLRAGVNAPLVGDRFHFSTDVVANGVTVAIDLCLFFVNLPRAIERTRL